jgi:acyl carrier protein
MEIEKKVNGIIATILGLPEEIIESEHLLVQDLGADSLDFPEIAMAIEEEFDVTVEEEMLDGIHRVSDIYNLLRRLLDEPEKA